MPHVVCYMLNYILLVICTAYFTAPCLLCYRSVTHSLHALGMGVAWRALAMREGAEHARDTEQPYNNPHSPLPVGMFSFLFL